MIGRFDSFDRFLKYFQIGAPFRAGEKSSIGEQELVVRFESLQNPIDVCMFPKGSTEERPHRLPERSRRSLKDCGFSAVVTSRCFSVYADATHDVHGWPTFEGNSEHVPNNSLA